MKKHALQSMTVWGLLLLVFGYFKERFGWSVTDTDIESAGNFVIPLAVALWGRFRQGDLNILGSGTKAALLVAGLALPSCAIPGTGDMNTPVTTTAQAAQSVGRTQGQSVSFVFADQTLTWDIRFPEDVLESMTDEQKSARDERATTALLLIDKAMDRFALNESASNAERIAAMVAMQNFAKGVGAATGALVHVSLDHADIRNSGDAAGLGGEGGSTPTKQPEKPELGGTTE